MDAPTRNLQNIKDKHADYSTKKCDNVPHPRGASVEPPWFETPNLEGKKNYLYARFFVEYYRPHCVIKVLILWPDKGAFRIYLYAIWVYPQYM